MLGKCPDRNNGCRRLKLEIEARNKLFRQGLCDIPGGYLNCQEYKNHERAVDGAHNVADTEAVLEFQEGIFAG